jgi:hypothetical protein
MTQSSSTAGRFGLAAVGTLLALLLAEGALSLSTGRSLRELATGVPTGDDPLREWRATDDDDRIAAANRNPGLYRVHEDPLVRYTLRAGAELEIGDGQIRTDELGMRIRPGPEQADDALVVVVLGDSVAFGHGVDDDQTLAHQLELLLAQLLPGDARQVVCYTVAVPGWNHRNAVHFLLDHFDKYAPDIVLYLPITNDLGNSFAIYDSGHRWDSLDPGSHDPGLAVSLDRNMAAVLSTIKRLKASGRPYLNFRDTLGPLVINGDFSPESSRRFDENARSILLLKEQLDRRGARLMLLQWGQEAYFWHLLRRLADADLALPVVPLFASFPAEFTLGTDPHSNPTTLGVVAGWCAEALQAEGWLEGLPEPLELPEPYRATEPYREARATSKQAVDWRRESESARLGEGHGLQHAVDTDTGQGMFQVYGGLNADGSARSRMLLLLPPGDGILTLRLSALPGRDDLFPQSVQVLVNGAPVGQIEVTAGDEVTEQFRWPSADSSEDPIEVLLVADREVVIDINGRSTMACYRLVFAATTDH